jgi:prepilin-type N-terminal cleavage/methylation domain-containing protein
MSRNSFGYTMVEVMVVLLILGIVSAVAVPSINSTLDEMKIDGAAREVVSAIYYSQSMAIKEEEIHKVNFNVAQDRFKCDNLVTGLTILHPVDRKPYNIDFAGAGHFQGVDIVSANFNPGNKSAVTFNSLGEPDKAGSVVLGYRGYQKTINVSLPLGKISVN